MRSGSRKSETTRLSARERGSCARWRYEIKAPRDGMNWQRPPALVPTQMEKEAEGTEGMGEEDVEDRGVVEEDRAEGADEEAPVPVVVR